MSDSEDECAQELECLESIYEDSYTRDERTKIFKVTLQAEEDDDDREERQKIEFDIPILGNFGVILSFKHPEGYPDTAIEFALEHVVSLEYEEEDDDEAHITKEIPDPFWFPDLKAVINDTIQENLESIQAFTVCSDVQDKLTELCNSLNEERRKKINQLKEEAEEAHTKKLIGTPVTLESFTEWKIKFQAEMQRELEKKQSQFERDMVGRATGKSMFQNKLASTEDELDIGNLVEEKDKVEVDTALFEDLEDLDELDEELENMDFGELDDEIAAN